MYLHDPSLQLLYPLDATSLGRLAIGTQAKGKELEEEEKREGEEKVEEEMEELEEDWMVRGREWDIHPLEIRPKALWDTTLWNTTSHPVNQWGLDSSRGRGYVLSM